VVGFAANNARPARKYARANGGSFWHAFSCGLLELFQMGRPFFAMR
jgi:hypothetical protein